MSGKTRRRARPFAVRPEDRDWLARGGFFSLAPSPGMRRLWRWWRHVIGERLTQRGRFALGAFAVCALLGVEPRRSQVFVLFAAGAGLFALPALLALTQRTRARLRAQLPQRLTAGTPVTLRVAIENASRRTLPDLLVRVPAPEQPGARLQVTPQERYVALGPGETLEAPVTIEAPRRGRYVLRAPTVAAVDPLRLVASAPLGGDDSVTLVYPRFYTIERFPVAMGRRYQPGGIPLSSNLGDSIEFIGTREYREGDPVRNIHWRSWARHGRPVVKEYQEEYFCRLALVLDTFVPRRRARRDDEGFEAAISVLASIADHFSRSEHVVDILAAGPDVYEVSAGRSLAYLDNILDVLACLGPCHEPPFERIGPHLFDRLAQLTTVVAVLLDWDEPRAAFLSRVRELGTEVQAVIVHAGETTRDWRAAADTLGAISCLTPGDVARLISAGPRTGASDE